MVRNTKNDTPEGWAVPHMVSRANVLGGAWMCFVSRRTREAAALQTALLQARSADDVRAAQVKYLQTAMVDYRAEAGKAMALWSAPTPPGGAEQGLDNVNI